ncbi:Spindle pole body-associated protein sad1 [Mycena sanguinolenta]|uniref:Spindle pole body-associated protein sad1 n=1 Tax=Mycena sanguinolenta TaxID=230812 RepID=A0A8H6ZCK7_9AGAR|nr:Spindle pole body-associated protein sad1 [Mycena sanguinolenta]
MSFTGTPLGQGRRRDHSSFLGKPQSSRINSHTSYSYGAPALGSRSPPKVTRQSSSESQSLDPEKWNVKDTSVNIAAAFHQAATDMQTPNSAWASGSTRTVVPRSTSVEYESQSQSTSARRLAAPPSRSRPPSTTTTRTKPLSKNQSIRNVPDSEGEEDHPPGQNGRGKSPFDQVIGAAKRAIINAPAAAATAATYYVRQRSREPDEPVEVNGSYDYSAEERDILSQNKRAAANHKRNRMSTDNKAYKPSASDSESDEDFTDDDGKKKRRKKKKKELGGGPLTTLPVTSYDKRKKRAKKPSKGNAGEPEVEEGSESDSHATDKQSVPRGSAPPSRLSQQPEQYPDTSLEQAEAGLTSIPEVEEVDIAPKPKRRSRSRSHGPSTGPTRRSFAPGAFIGTIFHAVFLLFGKVLGTMIDVMLIRPARIASRSHIGPFFKYALIIGVVLLALRSVPDLGLRLPWGGNSVYTPPPAPAGNVAEIAERLQRLETALSGLVLDTERTRTKLQEEARVNAELVGKVGVLETRVERESVRTQEAEAASRDAAGLGIKGVKQELESLQTLVQGLQSGGGGGAAGTDADARAKLKALEERVGSVEGGVREALEASKKGSSSSVGSAWWSKSGKSGLTIKSTDGQDVTAVISDLVNRAIGKDERRDFALYSSGGQIIPSLTSPTYDVHASTFGGRIVELVTGNGYAVGLPPITALHYDIHDGRCWPFAGSQGQLGVFLAAPVYIEDITIDHVAVEAALNSRASAPQDMEVWGLIEGADNMAKLAAWRADKTQRRENGEVIEDEPERPKSIPNSVEYIRIASFRYDVHSSNNIQTFPVDQEIKALGIDFGVVALVVKSNWGNSAFTCLYRFRVHGQRMGATLAPESQ